MGDSEGRDRSAPGSAAQLSRDNAAIEAAAAAGNAFLLPLKKRTNSIAVIDEHLFTRECISRSLQSLAPHIDVLSFATCDDCLRSVTENDLVLYHFHHMGKAIDKTSWLEELKGLLQIAPVIILSSVECPELVRDAVENGARGYMPTTSTTLQIAVEIIRLVRAGGTFLPSSFLYSRRLNDVAAAARRLEAGLFTPRQMAVLEHLQLGKTNKIIAHDLGMSESTVKVHIRNIMKKMKATNRTEVAYRARTLFERG